MDINKHLAVKVMGWTAVTQSHGFEGYYDDGTDNPIWQTDWNPPENIEQAFMCLDNFEDWTVGAISGHGKNKYGCSVYNSEGWLSKGRDLTPAKAICQAIAKATGWVVV